MSEFSVTFQGVRSALERNGVLAGRLAAAAGDVRQIRGGLTFEIRQRSQIDNRLDAAARALEEHNASLRRLVSAGSTVCGLYQRTENGLLGLTAGDIVWVLPQPAPDYLPGDGGRQSILEELIDRLLELLPELFPGAVPPYHWGELAGDFDLLKILDKLLGKLDVAGGGLLGDVTGYFESFLEFFTGDMSGLGGFADWANLADDSVGLWTGLYDLSRDLGAKGSLFTEQMADRVKGVALTGSVLGTVGAFMDMMDTDGKSYQQILDDIADYGASGVGTGISALAMLGKVGALPAHVYTSIAEAGFDTLAQIGDSIHEYYADGVWDLGDTGELMVDASCEGLYSLGNALTLGGLGWVLDRLTGNSDGDYGQMLSDTLKDAADDFSEWIVDAGREVGDFVSDAADGAKEIVSDVVDGFVDGWNWLFG